MHGTDSPLYVVVRAPRLVTMANQMALSGKDPSAPWRCDVHRCRLLWGRLRWSIFQGRRRQQACLRERGLPAPPLTPSNDRGQRTPRRFGWDGRQGALGGARPGILSELCSLLARVARSARLPRRPRPVRRGAEEQGLRKHPTSSRGQGSAARGRALRAVPMTYLAGLSLAVGDWWAWLLAGAAQAGRLCGSAILEPASWRSSCCSCWPRRRPELAQRGGCGGHRKRAEDEKKGDRPTQYGTAATLAARRERSCPQHCA
eukprot:scaffold3100_cov403-Prasinococcus_capsulatus_cf.AAC.10